MSVAREGDTVTVGQALCVIEPEGGVLNEVESEIAGKVEVIHVRNGARVELSAALIESVARRL